MRSGNLLGMATASVVALTALAACQPQPAPSPAPPADPIKVADEVRAAIHTQLDAFAERDPAKAASILAPDVISMFHGAPNVAGRAAGEESIKEQMADPAMKLEVSDETIDVARSGDMAVYQATYRFTFTDPAEKQPATETGNWVAIFTRQPDGSMKLTRDMVLDTPPRPQP